MFAKRMIGQGVIFIGPLSLFLYDILLKPPRVLPSEISDIRDIKGPLITHWESSLIVAVGFFSFFLLAAILLYKVIKWKRDKTLPLPPPDRVAYEALDALKTKDLVGQGKIRDYYVEISNIIRCYLANRFPYRALKMTTEEYLLTIKNAREFSLDQKILLKDFLMHCDGVKFAGYRPSLEEMEVSFKTGQKIIDQTREDASL